MKPGNFLLVLIALFTLLNIDTAAASDRHIPTRGALRQCGTLATECLNADKHNRTACYYSSFTHPFCSGTRLGDLLRKRWEYSASNRASSQAARMISPLCVENFDASLSSALISDQLTTQRMAALSEQLNSCVIELADDLVKP